MTVHRRLKPSNDQLRHIFDSNKIQFCTDENVGVTTSSKVMLERISLERVISMMLKLNLISV